MLLASLRFGAGLILDGYLQANMVVPTSMVYTGFGGSIQLKTSPEREKTLHYIIFLYFIHSPCSSLSEWDKDHSLTWAIGHQDDP